MTSIIRLLTSTALLCVIAGHASAQSATGKMANVTTVTEEMLRNPDPADWLHLGGNYEHWSFSRLDQITPANIGGLNLVWARQMVQGGQAEVSPLVHDGVMFLPNPFDTLTAIDAATGNMIWEYKRTGMPEVGGRDEEDKIRHTYSNRKRGIAIYGDNIIYTGSDDTVIAVDARSGQVVWETRRSTSGWANSSTGAIVANGVVVTGGSCQNAPINCFVTGHDVTNGEELWRNEVVPRPGEPGDETWRGVPPESRYCTGVWGEIIYDPVTNLVNYGSTGQCPSPDVQRGVVGMNATNSGTDTRWAVRPETGEVVWRRQIISQDNWDQECTFDMMVMDTPIHPDPNMERLWRSTTSPGTPSARWSECPARTRCSGRLTRQLATSSTPAKPSRGRRTFTSRSIRLPAQ